jgi:hypothetical protein
MLLQARSYKPGASTITLLDGSGGDTGYRLIGEPDWGNAIWDLVFSGTRGTRGARAVGGSLPNRTPSFSLRVAGSSKDDLMARLSTLKQLTNEWRRFGGQLIWRSSNQTYRQIFEVLAGACAINPWQARAEHSNRQDLTISFSAEPYLYGDPLDVLDDFSSDSLGAGSYGVDAGALANMLVSGGQLTAAANLTTENRLIRTDTGYSYYDHQVTLKAIPGLTVSGLKAGVVLKRQDASNYLEAYVEGAGQTLRLDKVVGGTRTNLANTALIAGLAIGAAIWIRGRIEGVNVFAEYFVPGPTPMATPVASLSYTLTGIELVTFSEAIGGSAGFSWIPRAADALLDDFTVEAYVYRNLTLPETVSLRGIPGDVPALARAEITPSGGAAPPIWASLGWWPRVPDASWNRIWNGDFENSLLAAKGWSVAAVLGLNLPATSITRITTAGKYGTCSGQIVCPATSGSGANFRAFRRFRKGTRYTAELWIHAASATTNVQLKLGNAGAGDVAVSGSTALSGAWQKISVSWTPAADYDDAHLGVVIAAATATTFEIDGAQIYEGAVAPASTNQSEGRGGFPPLGLIEAENSINGNVGNGNLRSGFGSTSATWTQVVVDPALLVGDDYDQNWVAIEVWGRMELTSASSGTVTLGAYSITLASQLPIFSEEFGDVGRALTLPSSGTVRRLVRLGTLRLPTTGGRYLLSCAGTPGASAPSIDYFVLLPAAARALSPSGRVNDASKFPTFDPVTSEVTRLIYPDLSGALREPSTGTALVAAPGLGGSLLEVPPGDDQAIVKLSSLVPDDPTSNTSSEQLAHSGTLHFAVTPRYEEART